VTVVYAIAILPPVLNPLAVPVDHMKASIWAPVTGGVMVVTSVVPVNLVRNVVGAIAAAEAIVTGLGCWLL
jgi:hypothetical protein